MFGSIKSNLIILAVALVAMFAAIAADAQTVELKSGSFSTSANGTETFKAKVMVGKVSIVTRQTTTDSGSKNKTMISNSFTHFDGLVSGRSTFTLNTNNVDTLDSSLTIKKTIGGVDLKASSYSLVRNTWDFSAAVTLGHFDVKVTETLNFTSGDETTKLAVDYDIPNTKYKINFKTDSNGSYTVGFKKGY